jgi:hypothetical protein
LDFKGTVGGDEFPVEKGMKCSFLHDMKAIIGSGPGAVQNSALLSTRTKAVGNARMQMV